MINAQNLTKSYGSLQVLKGVDFKIDKGEIISIVGPSGAGKTTLLQILGTLSKPDEGTIQFNGDVISKLKDKQLASFRNMNIGFVFQFHHLLPEFTALENVCIPAFIAKTSKIKAEKRAKEILSFLKLEHRFDHKPNELSGGEQQRVAVARALINNPSVILADEPSGNLDSENKNELHKLFFSLRDNYNSSIIIVTHDDSLADMADQKTYDERREIPLVANMDLADIKEFLDEKVEIYNNPNFIETDPISIPHQFTLKENIEISGFIAATIAWGQRKSIITNMNALIRLLDNNPYEFVMYADESDFNHLKSFKHRTFNGEDLIFFVRSLRNIYQNHSGLESVFRLGFQKEKSIISALSYFREVFFSIEHPSRTQKHVANIHKGAAAKRLNMYLRWMVRKDDKGVDFGIWDLPTSELMLPLDVHTGNVSRQIGILKRKQNDWKSVEEVSAILHGFDSSDPIKYDFALFGLGYLKNLNSMANSYFRFKQFIIHQDRTAMKVGTDGVLLGAWADVSNSNTILDLGTGTGLIAIMLAQRSNVKIDAVEIDCEAYNQAMDNVKECKWRDRIFLNHMSFQDYWKEQKTSFDLIVSNPPYFINSLHAPDAQRTQARHNLSLSYSDILDGALHLLSPKGRLSLILPYIEGSVFIADAALKGLYCNRKTNVFPNPGKPPKRLLLEFGKEKMPLNETSLVIENHKRHEYSEDYKISQKISILSFKQKS